MTFLRRKALHALSVLVLEAGASAGGNHTWSFHQGDLDDAALVWIAPFISARWPDYEVRFPKRGRTIRTGYASIASTDFAEILARQLGTALRTGQAVKSVGPQRVELEGGRVIEAPAVIDARGFHPSRHLDIRFQKFLGVEFAVPQGRAPLRPIVMDARRPQNDGYRFLYTLPFAPDRILVEDTYYADGDALDPDALEEDIRRYATEEGWQPGAVLRREAGILPIALGGDPVKHLQSASAAVPIGLRAGLFHPTTGYSLPDAVRTADLICAQPRLETASLSALLADHAARLWRERGLFRLLNRFMFIGADGEGRREMLQHFHRLPDDVIARFYAARLTRVDILRIFAGKPPMPIGKALSIMLQSSRPRRAGAHS